MIPHDGILKMTNKGNIYNFDCLIELFVILNLYMLVYTSSQNSTDKMVVILF